VRSFAVEADETGRLCPRSGPAEPTYYIITKQRLSVSSTLPAKGLDVSTSKVRFLLNTGTDFILGTTTKCQGKRLGETLSLSWATGGPILSHWGVRGSVLSSHSGV